MAAYGRTALVSALARHFSGRRSCVRKFLETNHSLRVVSNVKYGLGRESHVCSVDPVKVTFSWATQRRALSSEVSAGFRHVSVTVSRCISATKVPYTAFTQ